MSKLITSDTIDEWRERVESAQRATGDEDLYELAREMHDVWVAMVQEEANAS